MNAPNTLTLAASFSVLLTIINAAAINWIGPKTGNTVNPMQEQDVSCVIVLHS